MITRDDILRLSDDYGLSQADLARLTNFGASAVNRVFKGKEPTKNHKPGYYYLFEKLRLEAYAELMKGQLEFIQEKYNQLQNSK